MAPPLGYQLILLHAHLPFVRHPEHAEFLEEEWLFEAISETYIPLLRTLSGLARDGLRARLTMSLTPPLCEMLTDPLLQERYLRRLAKLEELAGRECARTRHTCFQAAAKMYREHFAECRRVFEQEWGRNLAAGFRHFQEAGLLELIASGATHGFLPLMATAASVRAQIRVGAANYRKHFGRAPRGFWLPECAYAPGLDRVLKEEGLEYFFLDTHGLAFAEPRPRYGPYRPARCESGIAVFARDPESSRQVWSSISGYPGDYLYREFYRDLGFDGEYNYLRPYLHADGVRRNLGLKYHRITGPVPLHEKQPYHPAEARERAAVHAGNFLFNRQAQCRHLRSALGVPPVIVSPYDAELFGHWWFEGPHFLDCAFRKFVCDQQELELLTPSEFLARRPRLQTVRPAFCSWGDQGYYQVWLNEGADWLYRHLHAAEAHMRELVYRFHSPTPLQERALKQAARELLLAQASDWAFILTAGTTVAYAEKRTRDHLHHFHGLYLQLMEDRLEEPWLKELEAAVNPFPEVDFRAFSE